MYDAFETWESATRAARRIYDPFAYRVVLQERLVPIVPAEAMTLAPRWPVMWQRDTHGDADLVVLRGLAPETEVPGAQTVARTALPLLLQAYPFRFRTPDSDEIGLDRTAPMRERDAGSYILDPHGHLLPGAEMKLQALEAWRAERDLRQRLTEIVLRHDLLEPVVLPETVTTRFNLPDFLVVVTNPDDRLIFGSLPREDWQNAARFLAAQRMSLYTMAGLIARSTGTP